MSSGGSDRSQRLVVLKGRLIASMASAFVMAITGIGWTGYHTALGKIIVSHVLPNAPTPPGVDQNILLMGLDSRLDQNGRPLPQEMYEALHAGDETSGGYNANVLIVVHISGDDGPVTAVSIPRDDYVDLSGCPGSVCKGKVKQAYGLAYQQSLNSQAAGNSDSAGATDLTAREQTARDAGRKAEIDTVNDFFGYLGRSFRRSHVGRILPNREGRGADHGVPQRRYGGQLFGCKLPPRSPADRCRTGDGLRAAATR